MNGTKDASYFTCTLGEAQAYSRPFSSVNDLIDQQAQNASDLPAVGFYRTTKVVSDLTFDHEILTFGTLKQAITAAAQELKDALALSEDDTVALLCSSSPEFLLAWLGLIRLGHSVLLLAPQSSPGGILHLCNEIRASVLLVDEKNAGLGAEAIQQTEKTLEKVTRLERIPFDSRKIFQGAQNIAADLSDVPDPKSAEIAYWHHTSGTSGKPKLIAQSQHGAVGALPALDGRKKATFTTTPLYHGGPADIFRAWSSSAMIWLFPSHEAPITAGNTIRCLQCAQEAEETRLSPAVRYFGSVPYVVQMMSEDAEGLHLLRNMDLVGVGGAALTRATGDELVAKSINLLSRFGSAECGFLLSSDRQYEDDRTWQYLRLAESVAQLRMEPCDGDLHELVVLSDWPHMAKRNRDDGSYATADLFEPHPLIKNAWRYHSRADAQLTLITGKKFDPEPVEAAIAAASNYVSDVLVFGNGQPYPGALLFRSKEASNVSDEDVVESVAPVVQKLNNEGDKHRKISSSMLVAMPYAESPLPKSSKGTVLRKAAEEQYAQYIEAAYTATDPGTALISSDSDIPATVTDIVRKSFATGVDLPEDANFFDLGVDSVMAMQIRTKLQQLLPKDSSRLPITVVEDAGNIRNLIELVLARRRGDDVGHETTDTSQLDYMRRLVDEYSRFEVRDRSASAANGWHRDGAVVVLTGATGALGAHVLDQLRGNPWVSKVICLVRGADSHAARERVESALKQRGLTSLDATDQRVEVIVQQAALRNQDLGISRDVYNQLANEATIIMHLAWSVNFRMKLQSFVKDSIASVRNLLDLSLATHRPGRARFIFCSSVASAMAYAGETVPEDFIDDPASASPLGYSQSKWVAEQICHRASQHERLRGKISVFRVGQLSGDSQSGVWNKKEAWPLMLNTVKVTQTLPELVKQPLDWLPVDIAATAMIEGALQESSESKTAKVYHLLNDRASTTWVDLLRWAKTRYEFEVVQPDEWIAQLERAAEKGSEHPALQLLDHWKATYMPMDASKVRRAEPVFETKLTRATLSSLQSVGAVDEAYFDNLWTWIQAEM